MITLVDNTTAAVNSQTFSFTNKEGYPATLFAKGLAGVETIILQFTLDNGANWTDVKCNASTVVLSATNNVMALNVVGRYRLVKDTTAGAVTVVLQTAPEA